MKVNLKKLADNIARAEGGVVKVGTPQVLEILGCLGKRWRTMPTEMAFAEAAAILARAGKR
jgi:hypothetical protein